jgi:sulfoxide reductase heme-binding subunit YedZ
MPGHTRKRLIRHVVLAGGSSTGILAMFFGMGSRDPIFRLSMGTAYLSLGLLAATLMIGPLNVVRGRTNPVSTSLRRDLGIWSGIAALAHLVLGLQVHLRGKMSQYFLYPTEWERAFPLRFDTFGLANWTGLLSGLVFLLLLSLSNDFSLRRLGTARWKSLQRWSYAAFVLLAIHGVLYQLVIESRPWGWVALFGALVVTVTVAQGAGFHRVRSKGRS